MNDTLELLSLFGLMISIMCLLALLIGTANDKDAITVGVVKYNMDGTAVVYTLPTGERILVKGGHMLQLQPLPLEAK